ncbi:MAG TPA: hypothetical protein VGO89_18925 [Streptomyces sp.]|jgi:hypothetical protein|nr:hypothetical protein [Streptomyces sp.]
MLDHSVEPTSLRLYDAPAEVGDARRLVARVALLLLAAAGLYQGVWAQVGPLSFFDRFPGGMSWVAVDGPYNEHLVRDMGGLVDGLSVVAIVAAWSLSRPLLAANALGWLVYALPHLGYHLWRPLDDAGMQALNVLILSGEVVLPVLGLLGASWSTRAAGRPGDITPTRAATSPTHQR